MSNKSIPIEGAFSKWFIEDKGRNNIPANFAGFAKNCRIVNGSTTVRRGISESYTLPWSIRGMHMTSTVTGSSSSIRVLTVAWNTLRDQNWIDLWTIAGTGKVNFISYGQYTIILTWTASNYVFSQNGGLIPVPPANLESGNVSWVVPWAQPIIGASLTGFTFIANNTPWYKNILHISKPITPDTPENCYDRSTTTGGTNPYNDVGENRAMSSNIVWLIGNINYLYIFCERTLEVLKRDSVQQFNGKWYLITTPIWDWDQLANPRSTICAGQIVFYFTKNLEIKTINLEPWIEYPTIWILSSAKRHSIKWWIQRNLQTDQRDAFMVYDKKENTVELYCKSKNSSYNDLVIVYNIIEDAFTFDTEKVIVHGTADYFSWLDTVYLWWPSGQVYIDDDKYHDEPNSWQVLAIPFEYDTPNIALWDPNNEKIWRWYQIAGAMNTLSSPTFDCYIDGKLEHTKQIPWSSIASSELLAINIWWADRTPNATDELSPFEFTADHWMVRKKGKRMRIKIRWNQIWQNMYFDSLSIFAFQTGNVELSDKY